MIEIVDVELCQLHKTIVSTKRVFADFCFSFRSFYFDDPGRLGYLFVDSLDAAVERVIKVLADDGSDRFVVIKRFVELIYFRQRKYSVVHFV